MTAVAPSTANADPPWNSLGRPTLGPASAPVPAIVLAGVTFGLLPAVIWPWRWATLLDRDRPYYRDLAHWWRRRAAPADAAQLDGVLARLRPRPILMVLPWLASAFTIATAVVFLLAQRPDLHDLFARLADCTYRFRPGTHEWGMTLHRHVHDVWLWGLAFAYGCHWYAVRSHAAAVGDLVRWTNRMAKGSNFRRVRNETGRVGLGPLWVAGGVGLCWLHAWWAIPMVLAGAARRRYADVAAPRLQQALSAQAGDAVALGGPGDAARFCPTPNCGNRLPGPAAFCPRCGTPTVVAHAG